ncbi:recombinase family protein [Paenibacillus pinihumi]|uniref:recombinase family protein n=1 Tax=Paenibacillus pinihumi TaxID=669462 RepID=UPI000426D3FA|nr:recombinase family protein [Paenibacillus pinihumi]
MALCIYRMYREGKGFDAIARTLTREGVPTPAQVIGKKNAGQYWQGSSIKLILSNPHYVGDLVQFRQTTKSVTVKGREELPKEKQIIVKDTHPAIISREDFEAVQSTWKGGRNNKRSRRLKSTYIRITCTALIVGKACGTSNIVKAMFAAITTSMGSMFVANIA